MLDTYMINWSGQAIPSDEMMVMRRVAVQMRTVYDAKEVVFTHKICAGLTRFEKVGVFGAVGGLYFFGDFGAKNNQPNTVNFFIPRKALHLRTDMGMVVSQSMKLKNGEFVPDDYPEDIDEATAGGYGNLKITVREEL